MQTVGTTDKLFAPALQKLAIGIEYNHGVVAFACGVHRVMHIDMALGVFAHPVRVAVFQAGGQLTPIVRYFIAVIAITDYRLRGSGFVSSGIQKGCGAQNAQCRSAGNVWHGGYFIANQRAPSNQFRTI